MNTATDALIELDGSQGEGGGQILRTALSLSMLRRQPVRIANIRAGRKKPGLMRQHLTCVRAAAAVSNAEVDGAEIGSTDLTFRPRYVRGGDFNFSIGSAGATMLVLQTVLPALLRAPAASTVTIEGGTHTTNAPVTDFISDAFLPLLQRMGAQATLAVDRHGFFPAGGGAVRCEITPSQLQPLALTERGDLHQVEAVVLLRSLPHHIVERELDVVRRHFGSARTQHRDLPSGLGPGNALILRARHAHVTEVVTSLGEQGTTAELVAERACAELKHYLAHAAPVGEHLSDQLLLPLVLAGGGEFVTGRPSTHLETNAAVIAAFEAARVEIVPDGSDPQRHYRVTVTA